MKFGKLLTEEQERFVRQGSHVEYGWPLYRELKKHIKQMKEQSGDIIERRKHEVDDELCSICLEPLDLNSHTITTKCGHKFHPMCLIDAVTDGTSKSCPNCRCPLKELIPEGFDGQVLSFAAKLRLNADSVQSCHDTIFLGIEQGAQQISNLLNRSHGKLWHSSTEKAATKRVDNLLTELHTAIEYDKLSVCALKKIVKKFDKNVGTELQKDFMERIWKRRFCVDLMKDGRAQQLSHNLLSLRQRLGQKNYFKSKASELLRNMRGVQKGPIREDTEDFFHFLPPFVEFLSGAQILTPRESRAELDNSHLDQHVYQSQAAL